MRKFPFTAAVAAGLLVTGYFMYSALAQQPGAGAAGPAPGGIAVIDINFLVNENPHLKAMRAEMEQDVRRAEKTLNAEREAIRSLTEQLKEQKAGSLEYKRLEEEITKRSTDLNVKVQLQRKEFAQKEAKNFFIVYQEIWQEVDYVASANNLGAVLKTINGPVDPEKPEEIVREMNKQIMWHSKALDITQFIHNRLLARYGQGAGTGTAPPNNARQGVLPPIQR